MKGRGIGGGTRPFSFPLLFLCQSFFFFFFFFFFPFSTTMPNDSDIQERIASARREAEALKERIKQRKEALADSTCNDK